MSQPQPEEVTLALSKLSPADRSVVERYISKLSSQIALHIDTSLPPSYDIAANKNDPDKAAQFKVNANKYRSNGNHILALDYYSKAIQAAPPSSLLLASRASVLFSLEKYRAAINDCNIALEKNCDCAKALRIRGRSYKMIGEYEKARKDLSTSQTIDYDSTAVEDLKEVTSKVTEKEKERAKKKNEEEDIKKKKLEELRKQKEMSHEKINKDKFNSDTTSTPGGMGGMMGSLFNDPEIAASLQNPKVQSAFSSMMSGGGLDMSKIQKCMSDPELAPIFQKLMSKLGPMMGNMGGMANSMSMDGCQSKPDEDVSSIDEIPEL